MAVEPDLVLAFSDLQADNVRELLKRGVTVFAFNQRSVEEILDMILVLSRICRSTGEGRRSGKGIARGTGRDCRVGERPGAASASPV